MEFVPLPLPGLFLLRPLVAADARGSFVKTFSADLFRRQGIDFVPREEFYSVSHAGVLRGMHFQEPPAAYGKIVSCLRGRVHDVVLDIRAGSPTYGRTWSGQLDATRREALFLPPGFAHGFYSFEADSLVFYSVSHGHDPAHDQGIRWDTIGHAWPSDRPLLSARDRDLPPLDRFSTPFSYS